MPDGKQSSPKLRELLLVEGPGRLGHELASRPGTGAAGSFRGDPLAFPSGTPDHEAPYRFIVENAGEGIAGLSADLSISYANRKLCSLHVYSLQELIGRPIFDLAGSSGREELKAALEEVRHGACRQCEVIHRRKDASEFWVSITARPIDGAGADMAYICLITDLTGRKSSEEKLERSNRELRRLSLELLQMQDAERRRIARELHDSTSPLLTGIILNLARMDYQNPECVRDLVPETLHLTRECLDEIRSISYLLHPPLLDDVGLAAALGAFAASLHSDAGIAVKLEIPPDLGRLNHDLELTLFRIVQEAVDRIRLAADTPAAFVRIDKDDHELRLEVCGALARRSAGTGALSSLLSDFRTLGIRERIEQFGGHLVDDDGGIRAFVPL